VRLVCISDTHNVHEGMDIPYGDVLIHTGDATVHGTPQEVDRFLGWFAAQPHRSKILCAGNHDWFYQREPEAVQRLLLQHQAPWPAPGRGIIYLEDSGVEIDGIKFWGSPWQAWPKDWAFTKGGEGLRHVRGLIPLDTDVVITHGPPHGILDQIKACPPGEEQTPEHMHLGCEELKIRLAAVQPKASIFGHVHSGYGVAHRGTHAFPGVQSQSKTTTYINASNCAGEKYVLANRPIVVDLTSTKLKVHGTEHRQAPHAAGKAALVPIPFRSLDES